MKDEGNLGLAQQGAEHCRDDTAEVITGLSGAAGRDGSEHEVFPLWENFLADKIPLFFNRLWCELRDSKVKNPAVV
ncbi:hypothetical protein APE01nite_14770 [Acetobacter peroxydans]|uniref:Uncharacterized protein n=1 Tax=Acetobacter peroxydans TaxID=104098 RepID=A0A4Y3TXH0_9PROT|nr:hypothetical protein AA0475_0726 [Acetobacter peroxydans]GEB85680.1 hypothetical protein APE01nite_14770 [Acetobacter peroxydans]